MKEKERMRFVIAMKEESNGECVEMLLLPLSSMLLRRVNQVSEIPKKSPIDLLWSFGTRSIF